MTDNEQQNVVLFGVTVVFLVYTLLSVGETNVYRFFIASVVLTFTLGANILPYLPSPDTFLQVRRFCVDEATLTMFAIVCALSRYPLFLLSAPSLPLP